MKKIFLFLGLIILSGCTWYKTPVIHQADLQNIDFQAIPDMKHGTSCWTRVLIFPVERDASILNAALEANISKVIYVDHEITDGLLFRSECVHVYGE